MKKAALFLQETPCIDISGKTAVIQQQSCLHCGNCYEICPARAIVKREVMP